MSAHLTRLPAPRHERPALELRIVQSTRYPDRLAFRLAEGFERQREVMEALEPAGFLEGDRVTLELRDFGARPMPGVEAIHMDLLVIRSTEDPSRLSLRCLDNANDGSQVMARLYPAGFRPGDRPKLRLLWRATR